MSTPEMILVGLTLDQFRAIVRAEIREAMKTEAAALKTPKMDVSELGALLKKKPGALRAWLMRHPNFPREHVGRRVLFDREKVRLWFESQGRYPLTRSRPRTF